MCLTMALWNKLCEKNITRGNSNLEKSIFIFKNREREDQWAQKDSQECQEIR